jgi:tetratricopeptide (TPR) repeat protein
MKNISLIFLIFYSSFVFSQKNIDDLDEVILDQIKNIDSIIEIEPTADNFFFKGEFEYNLHKYNDALEMFNKAIDLNSNQSDYFYWRGITLSLIHI